MSYLNISNLWFQSNINIFIFLTHVAGELAEAVVRGPVLFQRRGVAVPQLQAVRQRGPGGHRGSLRCYLLPTPGQGQIKIKNCL